MPVTECDAVSLATFDLLWIGEETTMQSVLMCDAVSLATFDPLCGDC